MSLHKVIEISTKPYEGQKPGTSGLRKKVKVFQQENYLANFVQSAFNALPKETYEGKTLLVSGDGRYYNREAVKIIAEIAAGNGVARLFVGQNGWMSTPAASCVIRERENGVCIGGFLLTASHNPGGPEEDFGVKYNCENGNPAPESLTNAIFEESTKIEKIKKIQLTDFDLSKIATLQLTDSFTVEIIDPVEDWLNCMKNIFDFDLLRSLLNHPLFSFVYDGLNGIAGPYAEAVFVKELGASPDCLVQCKVLEDFGGEHPDPNLTYAHKLVEIMKATKPQEATAATPVFGAAGDGDCDRNMILGRGWFVTPSDSVAIIAAYAQKCIPYFKNGLKGAARSMPTSLALKNVADKMGFPHYEVPTGWKFFGNLMDADLCSICGEESFGTGSDHIREKDGLWAVLAWLSILAYRNHPNTNTTGAELISVQQINEEFWNEFGRNYYTRYDYEGVETEAAENVMKHIASVQTAVSDLSEESKLYLTNNPLEKIEIFNYTDPVDQSVSPNQGIQVFFKDQSRFVLRLSGTGSSGATIRLYLERLEKEDFAAPTAESMRSLVALALDMTKMEKHTSRNHPTVIT